MDATSGGVPPRTEDLFRHLDDLRTNSFEGKGPRAERIELFRRAAELLGPVVRPVLDEANAALLGGTGEVSEHGLTEQPDGSWIARWELSWPEQRTATNLRGGDGVAPVQVVAWFAAGFTHPHLAGGWAGQPPLLAHWPLQVSSRADAERQEPIVRAIVEAEVHQNAGRVCPTRMRRACQSRSVGECDVDTRPAFWRIFEGGWRIVPGYPGRSGAAGQ